LNALGVVMSVRAAHRGRRLADGRGRAMPGPIERASAAIGAAERQ